METRWRRLIARADAYYDRDWRVVWFQPVLCLFVFGAALRMALTFYEPPAFHAVLRLDFYGAWLAMGMISPVLAGVSYLMIRHGGKSGVMGRTLRLGADVGMLTVLLSYHIVSANTGVLTESRLFSRYVLGASMVFVLELIVRDIWAIRLNNLRAHQLGRMRSG